MPDLLNREDRETDLASRIAKLLQRQLGQVMEELGDPPDVSRLTPEFWAGIEAQTVEVLRPQLEGVFLESAEQLMNSQPIGVEWGLINQRAADWASRYSYDLVRGVNGTTQNLLQNKVGQFFTEEGMTLGQLRRELQGAFGPVRADMIAITETTRAAVEGQLNYAEEINRELGVRLVPIWQTNRDDLVCPICGPLDGQEITDGNYPPAHVRCRCWVNHEIPA